tara:strand:- start:237 stop:344 length:108 start_codon:yes stop_codon:yes gene_type:complete
MEIVATIFSGILAFGTMIYAVAFAVDVGTKLKKRP